MIRLKWRPLGLIRKRVPSGFTASEKWLATASCMFSRAVQPVLWLAMFGQADGATGASEAAYRRHNAWFLSAYPRWQAQGVGLIDPALALFVSGKGRIVKAGDPLYFDSHHLSVAGARAVLAADPRR